MGLRTPRFSTVDMVALFLALLTLACAWSADDLEPLIHSLIEGCGEPEPPEEGMR